MEAMPEKAEIEIQNEDDIVLARRMGRDMAISMGFKTIDCTRIATAISELARNILIYTSGGSIRVQIVHVNNCKRGIEVCARDSGPGIKDISLVMSDGYSTSNGLGLGLPGAKRLMDEFEIESEVQKGTVVTVRKWL